LPVTFIRDETHYLLVIKMKITFKRWNLNNALGKVKDFASEYTKAFLAMFGGVVTLIISAIMTFHAEAQIDMMESNFIWGTCQSNINFFQSLIAQGFDKLRYLPFQDGFLFQTNTGDASDIFLSLLITGWALAVVGTFLIMLGIVIFYRANYLDAKNGVPKVVTE
jgi:disulfide bond formation protein DsbB